MKTLRSLPAICAVALGAVLAAPARAQAAGQAGGPCPQASEVGQQHLLGLWRAEFEGLAHGASLLLEPHPVYPQSLRGGVTRDGDKALLAGDVQDGEFSLEESADGVNISASWVGDVVQGSCGREIRGEWQATGATRGHTFVLRKQ